MARTKSTKKLPMRKTAANALPATLPRRLKAERTSRAKKATWAKKNFTGK